MNIKKRSYHRRSYSCEQPSYPSPPVQKSAVLHDQTRTTQEKEIYVTLNEYFANRDAATDKSLKFDLRIRERDKIKERLQDNVHRLEQRRMIKAKGKQLLRPGILHKPQSATLGASPERDQLQYSYDRSQTPQVKARTAMSRDSSSNKGREGNESSLEFKKRLNQIRPKTSTHHVPCHRKQKSLGMDSSFNDDGMHTPNRPMSQNNSENIHKYDSHSFKGFALHESRRKQSEVYSSIQEERDQMKEEDKNRLLNAFKDASDRDHGKLISNLKLLSKVGRSIDVLHKVVYDKLFIEDKDASSLKAKVLGIRSISDTSYDVSEMSYTEVQKFLDSKMRNRKIYEKITRTSVQEHLLKTMTLYSSIISKLVGDKQEDLAVMLLMLVKINAIEFEDMLASYKINLDLQAQAKASDSNDEVILMKRKLQMQEERLKLEEQRYQRNMELVNKKLERCTKERQELEVALMEKTHLLNQKDKERSLFEDFGD